MCVCVCFMSVQVMLTEQTYLFSKLIAELNRGSLPRVHLWSCVCSSYLLCVLAVHLTRHLHVAQILPFTLYGSISLLAFLFTLYGSISPLACLSPLHQMSSALLYWAEPYSILLYSTLFYSILSGVWFVW